MKENRRQARISAGSVVSISTFYITRNWPAVTAMPEIITVFAFASCPIGPKKNSYPKTTPR